jgi:hypothetical protein
LPLAVRQRVLFQHDGAPLYCWDGLDVEAQLQGLLSHRMEHLKDHVYAVPPRIFEDLVARSQAAVATVDTNTLRRVRENSELRTVVRNGPRRHRAPTLNTRSP